MTLIEDGDVVNKADKNTAPSSETAETVISSRAELPWTSLYLASPAPNSMRILELGSELPADDSPYWRRTAAQCLLHDILTHPGEVRYHNPRFAYPNDFDRDDKPSEESEWFFVNDGDVNTTVAEYCKYPVKGSSIYSLNSQGKIQFVFQHYERDSYFYRPPIEKNCKPTRVLRNGRGGRILIWGLAELAQASDAVMEIFERIEPEWFFGVPLPVDNDIDPDWFVGGKPADPISNDPRWRLEDDSGPLSTWEELCEALEALPEPGSYQGEIDRLSKTFTQADIDRAADAVISADLKPAERRRAQVAISAKTGLGLETIKKELAEAQRRRAEKEDAEAEAEAAKADGKFTELSKTIPLPGREYGRFSYRAFDRRPWVYVSGGGDRLWTPWAVARGVEYPDRGGAKGLTFRVQDESRLCKNSGAAPLAPRRRGLGH